MTIDNLIIIIGGSYNDIKKALQQWIELYSEDLSTDLTFELYRNGRRNHIIKADDRLDNERFYYLINYLNYPEGIEYKIDIEGFTTVNEQKELQNQKILVYISANDTEGDNVFAVTSDNETFKIDFGGKVIRVNNIKTYKTPDIPQLSNPEIIRPNKKQASNNRKEKSKDNPEKRFRIISLIALGLLIISLLTLLKDNHTFFKATFFVGMGLGVWFFGDYKMLQVDKYYLYCLFIAIIFLSYGLLIKKQFSDSVLKLADLGSLYPISLLIVQKPLRLIYKKILKREPVIDRPPPTFWDFIYTILLFLAFAVLPLIIMDNLE